MSLKIKFHDYLNEFRNTRNILTTPAEMIKFSNDYSLDYGKDALPMAIYTYGFDRDASKNSCWLIQDKDGLFTVDICNASYASYLLSDIEYELAEYYYGEEYYWVPKYDEQQTIFLNNVKDAITGLRDSHRALAELWANDHNFKIDLNELLTAGYPFDHSFDEMDIDGWHEQASLLIKEALTTTK